MIAESDKTLGKHFKYFSEIPKQILIKLYLQEKL